MGKELGRRTFMGVVVVGAPLTAALGHTVERQVEQLQAIPLAPPPVGGIEWLVKQQEPLRAALGRYEGRLTEALLLEAVSDCGFKPRTVLLSMVGVKDYVELVAGDRRYGRDGVYSNVETPRGDWNVSDALRSTGYEEDSIVFMAPGQHVRLECHFSLPAGTLAIS